jgi:hypothetical protein
MLRPDAGVKLAEDIQVDLRVAAQPDSGADSTLLPLVIEVDRNGSSQLTASGEEILIPSAARDLPHL